MENDYMKLDPKAVKSWRVGKGILLFFQTLIFIGGIVFICIIEDTPALVKWILLLSTGIAEMAVLAVFILYPIIEYRQWGYLITDDRIEIRHGIFFINRKVIPIIRIQNITVQQGPINRRFGLYNIRIFTASGNDEIPCLDKKTADTIADNLKNRIYERLKLAEQKSFSVPETDSAAGECSSLNPEAEGDE